MHGERLLANKNLQLSLMRPESREPPRPLSSFTLPPLDLSLSVLLCGESGIGKTCFAEAHGSFPYYMKTLDQLRFIPGNCDLLIFDDMRFDASGLDLTPEEMIALLDTMRTTSIKCRHFDGRIPPIPRIFTSNLNLKGKETIFPEGANSSQQDAIDRRYSCPHGFLRTKLYED